MPLIALLPLAVACFTLGGLHSVHRRLVSAERTIRDLNAENARLDDRLSGLEYDLAACPHIDKPCLHPDFAAFVDVGRIVRPGEPETDDTPASGFTVDIRVECAACGEQLVFHGEGIPVGLLSDRPCISPDGTELRVPARPRSADPHFGHGLPGFVARVEEQQRGRHN